jgi:hypothetical protein
MRVFHKIFSFVMMLLAFAYTFTDHTDKVTLFVALAIINQLYSMEETQ